MNSQDVLEKHPFRSEEMHTGFWSKLPLMKQVKMMGIQRDTHF